MVLLVPEIFLEELEPYTDYEFRIGIECADYSIAWSEVNNFVSDPRILTGTSNSSENQVQKDLVRIYPNPTKGRFVFQYDSGFNDIINFSIRDLKGQVVRKNVSKISQGENQISVDLTGLPAGTYVLEGLTLGRRIKFSKRVVKTR